MEEDLKINRCKKLDDKTCPHIDKPEIEKTTMIYSEKELGEPTGRFDPIAHWENLKRANDKFCISCDRFEER